MAVRGPSRRGRGRERGGDWMIQPCPDEDRRAGDVFIARGTRSGAERLAELTGSAYSAA